MLNTTFNLAHKAGACTESYKKMAVALDITKYRKDTPIPLSNVLEVCGLHDAIWAMRCTQENSENFIIEFACRCAEHTLCNYENLYPEDKRPRKAIEAARVCITDKSETARSAAWSAAGSARSAAWSAAGSAAWSAAGSAARSAESAAGSAESAARSAAWSAETEWQTKTFLEMLDNYKL